MQHNPDIKPDYIIDAQGLLCPIPVLKMAKKASQVKIGSIIELHATDPMSPIDSQHFCNQKGYDFLGNSVKKVKNISIFCIKIRIK